MKTVKTQFGKSASADLEDQTWTFEMPEDYKVWGGDFAIVDKQVYDKLIKSCLDMVQAFNDAPTEWLMTQDVMNAESVMMEAINEATSDPIEIPA